MVDAISARKALVEVCVDYGEGAALCKAKARFDGLGGINTSTPILGKALPLQLKIFSFLVPSSGVNNKLQLQFEIEYTILQSEFLATTTPNLFTRVA